MLSPDDVLSARYRLDEPVASGGMGDVWRAYDLVLGRTVAVKVMRPALLTDPGFEARFRAEARMMAGLRHPGVVDVYDYGESELPGGQRAVYLVMAYVDGEPLSRMLDSVRQLPVDETLSLVTQAAEALHAAHASGIVHRDVKPGNLLVKPDGTVVLVDFGVARSAAATRITGAESVMGTALYMAPEQASGASVSAATDIYALGVVAYHCLTGRPPFTGGRAIEVAFRHVHDDPPALPDDVPPPVRALVERAMAKDPADRFADALGFAAAARAAAAVDAVESDRGPDHVVTGPVTDPPTLTDLAVVPGPPPQRRRRTALAGAALAILLGLAGLVGVLGLRSGGGVPAREGTAPSSAPAQTPTAKARSRPPGGGSSPARPSAPPASALPTPPASAPAGGPGPSSAPEPTGGATPAPEPTGSVTQPTATAAVIGTAQPGG